jgi:hypothetical protein
MGFDGSPRHFELRSNLSVVAPLQQEFDDLFFART